MTVSLEEFGALKNRVAALETTIDTLVAQLDDNAKNNGGALSDSYANLGSAGNDEYTVTNLTNYIVKFKDLAGTEHTLGAAGGSQEAATAVGLSSEITDLETASKVSVAAV